VDHGQSRLFNDEGTDMDQLLDKAAADLAHWASEGIQTLSVLEPGYPENLSAVHDRPPLIFISGRLLPRDARSVAVIGSRRASAPGLTAASVIAEHLGSCGYTVVSGLAAGIDSSAHRAALTDGTRTVAVIGTGLERCYPPENAPLQDRIACDGAVVSRFWPGDGPTRQSFPMRNAVMSGMALATVVVEAGARSGARVQSRLALAHGRPVFLLESLLAQQWARELASRPAVYVVRSAEEITLALDRLGDGALVA
jgi:DNA processing protein